MMSVKNELNKFFDRLLEEYKKTSDGFPIAPGRKDIDQTIYVGDADSEGWCKWKPVPYFQNEKILKLFDLYGIEKNIDITIIEQILKNAQIYPTNVNNSSIETWLEPH